MKARSPTSVRRMSGGDQLYLGALRLVLRELERLDGVLQRKLSRQQRPHVYAARRQVIDGPVELNAPAECTTQVELLAHDLVDDERQRLVRQGAHLHDDAAALRRSDTRLERVEAAGRLEGDVELRRRQRVRFEVRTHGAIRPDLTRF